MLYGGVQDLEAGVGQIVYDLFKRNLIKTTWSCEGHIGREVDGYSTGRPGYLIYQSGRIHFEYASEDEGAVRFIDELQAFVGLYDFASLHIRQKEAGGKLTATLCLEMKDLVDQEALQMDTRNKTTQILLEQRGSDPISYRYEVPEAQAKTRLEEFRQFWTKLETWVRAFRPNTPNS